MSSLLFGSQALSALSSGEVRPGGAGSANSYWSNMSFFVLSVAVALGVARRLHAVDRVGTIAVQRCAAERSELPAAMSCSTPWRSARWLVRRSADRALIARSNLPMTLNESSVVRWSTT
jgi:hypothetical protein